MAHMTRTPRQNLLHLSRPERDIHIGPRETRVSDRHHMLRSVACILRSSRRKALLSTGGRKPTW
eukprot:scaffold1596_cov302-Pinguiococcus_pyrenoidosus.AAC.17